MLLPMFRALCTLLAIVIALEFVNVFTFVHKKQMDQGMLLYVILAISALVLVELLLERRFFRNQNIQRQGGKITEFRKR